MTRDEALRMVSEMGDPGSDPFYTDGSYYFWWELRFSNGQGELTVFLSEDLEKEIVEFSWMLTPAEVRESAA